MSPQTSALATWITFHKTETVQPREHSLVEESLPLDWGGIEVVLRKLRKIG